MNSSFLLLQQVTGNNVEGGVGMKTQESCVFIDLFQRKVHTVQTVSVKIDQDFFRK